MRRGTRARDAENAADVFEKHVLCLCCLASLFDGTYAATGDDVPLETGKRIATANRAIWISSRAPRRTADGAASSDGSPLYGSAPNTTCVWRMEAGGSRWRYSSCGVDDNGANSKAFAKAAVVAMSKTTTTRQKIFDASCSEADHRKLRPNNRGDAASIVSALAVLLSYGAIGAPDATRYERDYAKIRGHRSATLRILLTAMQSVGENISADKLEDMLRTASARAREVREAVPTGDSERRPETTEDADPGAVEAAAANAPEAEDDPETEDDASESETETEDDETEAEATEREEEEEDGETMESKTEEEEEEEEEDMGAAGDDGGDAGDAGETETASRQPPSPSDTDAEIIGDNSDAMVPGEAGAAGPEITSPQPSRQQPPRAMNVDRPVARTKAMRKVRSDSNSATKVPTSFDGIGGRGYREKYKDYLRRPTAAKVLLHLGRAGTRFGIGATLQTEYSPAVRTRHFMPFRGYRKWLPRGGSGGGGDDDERFATDPDATVAGLEQPLLVNPNRVAPASGADQRQTPFFDLERGIDATADTRDALTVVRRACVCMYATRDGTLEQLRESVAIPAALPPPASEPRFHAISIPLPNPAEPTRVLLCAALCNRHNVRTDANAGRGRLDDVADAFWRDEYRGAGGVGPAYVNEPRFSVDKGGDRPTPATPGVDPGKAAWQYHRGASLMAAAADNLRLACNLYAFELWERAVLTTCGVPEVEASARKATPGDGSGGGGGDATDFEHSAMIATCLALWGERCFDPAYDGVLYLERQSDPAKECHRSGTALMLEVLLQYNAYAGTLRGKTSRRRRVAAPPQTMERRMRDMAAVLDLAAKDPTRGDNGAIARTIARIEAALGAVPTAAATTMPLQIDDETKRTFRARAHERASALAGAMMGAGSPYELGAAAKRAYGTLAKLRRADAFEASDADVAEMEAELARVSAATVGLVPGCYPGGLLYDVAHDRYSKRNSGICFS